MERSHRRGRGAVALGIALAWMLLTLRPCAFALNPALDVSQYAHTAWKIREGFPKGQITSIAQTPDGYLWLGTEFGLVRFDGVRNVPWQPPQDQHLPSNFILSLLVARDGTLWIGTWKGLASWKGGKLRQYAELAGQYIFNLVEDREGAVWASGLGVPTGRLCAIQNGSVQCHGEDGSLGHGGFSLYEDSKGNLWLGVLNGLWRWKPGPPKFYLLPGEPNGIQGLGEDEGGALLFGWRGGVGRLVDGKSEAYPLPGIVQPFAAKKMLRDRDGGLWIGSSGRGLVHVHQGRADVFAQSDGLSSGEVYDFFQDHEGNIWVSTLEGLDRFRDFAVTTITRNQGLSNSGVGAVLAARDGSVWLSAENGLNRWNDGQITTYDKRDGKLNGLNPHSLFQDDRGLIWVSTRRDFGYLEGGRFVSTSAGPRGVVNSIVQDTTGILWVANEPFGLFQLLRGSVVQQIPWAGLGHKDHASTLAADPSQGGGLWIGFHNGGVAYFTDGRVRASYGTVNGLAEGRVNHLQFGREGALWAATDGGLSRLKDGRVATLTSKSGLPCDTVHWAIEDDAHSFWLYTACGLVRIARPELDTWVAAVEKDKDTKRTIQVTVFDSSDGVRSLASGGHYSPQVAKTSDGRLWFLPWDGVSVLEPRHLPYNQLPPPVHIERITADRKTYDATPDGNGRLRLPPLIRDLQIDYTALSLVAPEKVLFRYQLEGWDRDWQEAGTRRQAFYSNLPPRTYRFRLSASNNSGVWNEAGTFLNFAVAPAYYQTTWFRLSCFAALLALLWALYQLRLRQVARQFEVRMEERVNERTRIARDFHDTLLQSFQGVLMKFHAVTYQLPDRSEVRQTLESIIEQARQAVTEGRDAVHGLRSSTTVTNDLARAISTFAEALAADHTGQSSPDVRVIVEGRTRDLAPLVRDEIHRIATEAVRNAFRHAHARRIEVEIQYEQRQLRLQVRDDGKGIEPSVLGKGARAGHHGLPGMHERARLVGGKLALRSKLDSGTEAELTIPASVAYEKSPVARWWRWQWRDRQGARDRN